MYDVRIIKRNGDIVEIGFVAEDGSVGPFLAAHSGPADSTVPVGFTRVPEDQLVGFLASILQDRSDLRALPDFAACSYDVDGNPKVWGVVVQCSSCDNEWSYEMASVDRAVTDCQVCGSAGILDEDTLAWIGPRSDILQTLWERMKPATFAVTASDDTGSEAAIEINGTGYLFKINRH